MKRTLFVCCIIIIALTALFSPVRAEDFPISAPAALPGTTIEMISPKFWIDRLDDPDRIIMTANEIIEFNRKNASRTVGSDHPYRKNITQIEKDGPVFTRLEPFEADSGIPAAAVRKRLDENIVGLNIKTYYDRWALPYTDEKKADIIGQLNLDSFPGTMQPKIGMIVRHTTVRLYPVAEPGYLMRNYLDDFSVTSLDIGMPAAVLHASKRGDYLFVMTPIAWGWLPAVDIAFASERKIRAYGEQDRFIVVTGHKIPLYGDKDFMVHAGWLYMGERLPLVGKSNDGYRVSFPERDIDGKLEFEKGWVKAGPLVHEGWLPYTKRNVITTAFRLLGRQYGWHDSWDERDCGGIMRVIFNCFGITLPRYWSFQQLCSDHASFVGNIGDIDEKNRLLGSKPAGITFIGTTGHIGLYLGTVDGKPYGIHECGWNYKRDDKEYKMARVVVSDFENVGFDMKGMKFFTPVMP